MNKENSTTEDIETQSVSTQSVPLCARVSYKGSAFCGFARQPGHLTVQGEIEKALLIICRCEILTVCAGRTDTGVHALGQMISFSLPASIMAAKTIGSLERSLNALTHDDISIYNLKETPLGFSARFDAKWREYRYFIAQTPSRPIFMTDFSWYVSKALNIPLMCEAASYLQGEHDFKSFCVSASAVDKNTVREILDISIYEEVVMGEKMQCIKVRGNAFLHSMVRTIVGTLVDFSHAQRNPSEMKEVLAAHERRAAGQKAPAAGLVFWHVEY